MDRPERPPMAKKLVFLKLGGSLITDKNTPRTSRIDVLQRAGIEIKTSLERDPSLQILLGHGSGSFGHFSGKKYNTRSGVSSKEEWMGFAEVWHDAASLNKLVIKALKDAGLSPVSFPPSSAVITSDREIKSWDMDPIRFALDNGLLPVVFGDVVFDSSMGGTILSTEELFVHLAREFEPDQILLAGQDPGVWKDFPDCTSLFNKIRPADRKILGRAVGQSHAPDVTGGMANKVDQMLNLIEDNPQLDCLIFSGKEPGSISGALAGRGVGTLLTL